MYGRVILQNASSQPKSGQNRALKQRALEIQASHHDHVRKNWVTLTSTAIENEERFRRGWRPPSKFSLVRFDRDDLRHKVEVKTPKWTVTKRNLQVTITLSDTVNLPPLDERNVWELADRQVTKQSPKLPASIDAGKFRWLLKRPGVSTSEEVAVSLIVTDAADAEGRGNLCLAELGLSVQGTDDFFSGDTWGREPGGLACVL